jgi:hypothetical protein
MLPGIDLKKTENSVLGPVSKKIQVLIPVPVSKIRPSFGPVITNQNQKPLVLNHTKEGTPPIFIKP